MPGCAGTSIHAPSTASLRSEPGLDIITPMNHTGRKCACGAAIVLVFVNGLPVERCEQAGIRACPVPPVEWVHGHTREPGGAPPLVRPVFVLSTSATSGR